MAARLPASKNMTTDLRGAQHVPRAGGSPRAGLNRHTARAADRCMEGPGAAARLSRGR
jgi:hypothetical protein